MSNVVSCWICNGRHERQVALRPAGRRDGRRVCAGCVRRLLHWLRREDEQRTEGVARIWGARSNLNPGEEWRDEIRALFSGGVLAALAAADAPTCASAALAYLDMGLVYEALDALGAAADCGDDQPLHDRMLVSLLTRLLDPVLLMPGAREELAAVLYA